MTIFCSAQEFDGLCGAIAGKAESIHLQAKGGSMYPFIRSGDWVDVVLTKRDIRKGDIILFRKGPSLYLHRVLSRSGDGFLVKGDMSSGADGVIPLTDILARAVSIHRGRRRIDLRSRANRIICILAADVSRVVRLPLWLSGNICRAGAHCLSGLQRLRAYRRLAKRHLGDGFRVREAEVQDEEGLRDLYLMAGHDVREGLARMKRDGFWLVAERAGKLAGGLTVSRSDEGRLWLIFGLEVRPFFRGMGTGRELVKEAVRRARQCGAAEVGLLVNRKARPALALYRSLGFLPSEDLPTGLNRSPDELYLSLTPGHILLRSIDGPLPDGAVKQGIFYPLYELLPAYLRKEYRQMHYLHIARSEDFRSRAERVLQRLDALGMDILLFKGPAVDTLIYKDFLRPRLDLDIAVRDGDMASLEKALAAMGYTAPPVEKDEPSCERRNSRLFTCPSADLLPLHVHRHLVNNLFMTVDGTVVMDMKKVWEETELLGGYSHLRCLKAELNILYLCDHGLKHDFDQAVFLYEIERLLSRYAGVFDWGKLTALAGGSGLGRSAYCGLYLAREVMYAPVPDSALEELSPAKLTSGERSFIRMVLENRRRSHSCVHVYLAMRRGLKEKIRFIFRVLFPPGFTLKGNAARLARSILPQ